MEDSDINSSDAESDGAEAPHGADAPKRSMICAICFACTNSYHLNYGANSCLSCRAFFRRAVKGCKPPIKEPVFKCKDKGKCEIDENNRRKCKRCRFDRCKSAGMKPDCVLNEGQVQVRFRKMLKKKKQRKKASKDKDTKVSESNCDEQTNSNEVTRKKQKRVPDRMIKEESFDSNAISTSTTSTIVTNDELLPHSRPDSDQLEPLTDVKDVMLDIPDELDQILNQVLENDHQQPSQDLQDLNSVKIEDHIGLRMDDQNSLQLPTLVGPEFTVNWNEQVQMIAAMWDQIVQDQQDMTHCLYQLMSNCLTWNSYLFHRQLKNLSIIFHKFAHGLPDFKKLDPIDQETLLNKNMPKFIHYVLGRYFSAKTGMEQMHWLFLNHECVNNSFCGQSFLTLVSIIEIGSAMNMFENYFAMNDYFKLSMDLGSMPMPPTELFLMALYCLFKADFDVHFVNHKAILSLHQSTVSIMCFGHPNLNYSSLDSLLSELCLKSKLPYLIVDGLKTDLAPNYSKEEEHWLVNNLSTFHKANKVYPFGLDLIKEYTMNAFGEPCSKLFFPQSIKVALMRNEYTLNTFMGNSDYLPGIEDLDLSRKELLCKSSALDGVAVTVCRQELCKSGNLITKLDHNHFFIK